MVRQDIVAAFKNAVERGFSVSQAKQSLINSGYSPNDVEEAASYLAGGFVSIEQMSTKPHFEQQPEEQHQIQQPTEQQQEQPQQPILKSAQPQKLPEPQKIPEKKDTKGSTLAIILVIILLFLIIGSVLAFIFRENISTFISGLS